MGAEEPPVQKMFAEASLRRFPLGYSTLGCPDVSLQRALELGKKFNLDFLELRILEERFDLFNFLTPDQVLNGLRESDLKVKVVGSSFLLTNPTEESLKTLWATCSWASRIGSEFVRVFSGGDWPYPLEREGERNAAVVLKEFNKRKNDNGWKCELALETHDSLSSAKSCRTFFQHIETELPTIWDTHHTWRLGTESPEESWRLLQHHIVHLHVKDSLCDQKPREAWKYCLPGCGNFPAKELSRVVERIPKSVGISLEWEKKWHPNLPPLEEALARWF